VLTERRFKGAVDADWAKSRRYGLTGVPMLVAAGHGVGRRPAHEVLVHLLERVGAQGTLGELQPGEREG
jgi:predicted DsbA family dithiol-disulfide isomerase